MSGRLLPHPPALNCLPQEKCLRAMLQAFIVPLLYAVDDLPRSGEDCLPGLPVPDMGPKPMPEALTLLLLNVSSPLCTSGHGLPGLPVPDMGPKPMPQRTCTTHLLLISPGPHPADMNIALLGCLPPHIYSKSMPQARTVPVLFTPAPHSSCRTPGDGLPGLPAPNTYYKTCLQPPLCSSSLHLPLIPPGPR